MHLGAITSGLLDRPFREVAKLLHDLGLTRIEPPAGGFFPKNHCNAKELLADEAKYAEFQQTLADYDLKVSAYAIHGQPLHPDPKIAAQNDEDLRETCALAEKTGVDRITLLCGIPEARPGDLAPNWIVFPLPPEFQEWHNWQWEERAIPHWKKQAKVAEDHGVRLCFEMVPCDLVFNPEGMLRLRDAVGPTVGCNFDPSHLFWQGIDCIEAIRVLKDCIYHAHAKDTRVDPHVVRINGVNDPKPYDRHLDRSWVFRSVGYGHGEDFWTDYLSMLRTIGYNDVVSIEHEDQLIDPAEGFEYAIKFLQKILIKKSPAVLWDA